MKKIALIFTLFALLLSCCTVAFAATSDDTASKADEATTETTNKLKPLKPEIKHLDLVLVLDKSGSMYGLESDTIGGYNSMIAQEKELKVDTKVTTVLFNENATTLYNRKSINKIPKLTDKEYRVGGSTALLDAVGNTINKVADTPDIDAKDHKVIFVIITDGLENSSHEYTKAQIKKMISEKQEKGWDFIFLGANIDAVAEADSLGIDTNHAIKYRQTSTGVQSNYDAIAAYSKATVQQTGDSNEVLRAKVEQDQ